MKPSERPVDQFQQRLISYLKPFDDLRKSAHDLPVPLCYRQRLMRPSGGNGSAGVYRCSEFACQNCQRLLFHAVCANRANFKINNLLGISRIRTRESLFLRHFVRSEYYKLKIQVAIFTLALMLAPKSADTLT
jgi:hypothetical protein